MVFLPTFGIITISFLYTVSLHALSAKVNINYLHEHSLPPVTRVGGQTVSKWIDFESWTCGVSQLAKDDELGIWYGLCNDARLLRLLHLVMWLMLLASTVVVWAGFRMLPGWDNESVRIQNPLIDGQTRKKPRKSTTNR
jgi:hypothetical protein